MRAPEPHGHAEPLARSHSNVHSQVPRGLDQRQRQQIRGGDDQRLRGLCSGDDRRHAARVRRSVRGRVLQQHAGVLARAAQARSGGVAHNNGDADPHCTRADRLDRLRVHIVRDEEARALPAVLSVREVNGLRCGRGLIQQRRVGDVHAGHVSDLR